MFAAGASFSSDFDLKKGGWQYQKRAKHFSNAGYDILDGDWDKFARTLDELRARRPNRRHNWYGAVESWLMRDQSPELSEFKEFLLEHAKSRQPLSSKLHLLRTPLGLSPRITMRETAKLVGRSCGTLWRGLKQLGIADHALGPHDRDTISLEAVEELKQFFADALGAFEAAAILGVQPLQLRHWTSAGLLTPLLPMDRTKNRKLYKRSDIESFGTRIADAAPFVKNIEPDQTTLAEQAHWTHVKPADALRAILGGQLKPVGRLESSNPLDLSRIVVMRSDVRRLEARKLGALSLRRSVLLLGFSEKVLRALLPQMAMARATGIITFDQLVQLDETYLSLTRMAQLSGSTHYEALKRLRCANVLRINPVGSTPVFLRAQVEPVLGPLPRLTPTELTERFA
jgi:hypothetical protein